MLPVKRWGKKTQNIAADENINSHDFLSTLRVWMRLKRDKQQLEFGRMNTKTEHLITVMKKLN